MNEIRILINKLAENGLSREEENHRLIKFLLMQRGISQADLARRIGGAKQNINDVCRGLRKTPRIRKGIAEVLGVGYLELWGEEESNEAA